MLDFEGLTFIKVKKGTENKQPEILNNIVDRYYRPLYNYDLQDTEIIFHAQPLTAIHFSEELLADSPKGSKTLLVILSIISFLILIVSSINYINLSIGQSSRNLKSIAITCIVGAKQKEIFVRFLVEATLLVITALLLGIALTYLFTPILNIVTSKDISILDLFQPRVIAIIITLSIFIILISGSVPAFNLRKTNALSLLQNNSTNYSTKFKPILVTLQFIVAIIMIFSSLVFHNQLQFMLKKDMGFESEKTVAIEIPDDLPNADLENKAFKEELQTYPWVGQMAYGSAGSILGDKYGGFKMMFANKVNGRMKQFIIHFIHADREYLNLLGVEMIEGENFSTTKIENLNDYVIVNEAYMREMEMKGSKLGVCPHDKEKTILGIVKDFNFMSLHNKIEPLSIMYSKSSGLLFLKIAPQNIPLVEKIWHKHFPDAIFSSIFLDQNFEKEYATDKKNGRIIGWFTWISVLITCFGLFGLALLESQSRTKEIGIRKVNGAKISEILTMLNKDFAKWVAIAFVIATPIAWYAMYKWLENFAYKTELSWWIFALAGILALGIALLTVSWQSWRAATRNPVEALRYE